MDPSFPLSYQKILDRIHAIDPKSYAKTRNHLKGKVSYLSPYITRGTISRKQIASMLLEKFSLSECEKFIQELAWGEYFYKVYKSKGSEIFTDLKHECETDIRKGIPASIENKQTNIATIDNAIEKLYSHGYLHNHERMWIASLTCNLADHYWLDPSKWMYYHLLDGDVASNTLSWQWVAGTFSSKPYTFNQDLIAGCGGVKEQNYLNIPRENILEMNIPEHLTETKILDLQWKKPLSDNGNVEIQETETVALYHSWHLDPLWRNSETFDHKILVLEPSHFEKFPVSEKVTQFIIDLAKENIPDIQIFVGEVSDIPGIHTTEKIFTKEHIHTEHFPGHHDPRDELFPEVQGYYPSFFSFWKQCKKHLGDL